MGCRGGSGCISSGGGDCSVVGDISFNNNGGDGGGGVMLVVRRGGDDSGDGNAVTLATEVEVGWAIVMAMAAIIARVYCGANSEV